MKQKTKKYEKKDNKIKRNKDMTKKENLSIKLNQKRKEAEYKL